MEHPPQGTLNKVHSGPHEDSLMRSIVHFVDIPMVDVPFVPHNLVMPAVHFVAVPMVDVPFMPWATAVLTTWMAATHQIPGGFDVP